MTAYLQSSASMILKMMLNKMEFSGPTQNFYPASCPRDKKS